MEFKYSDAGRKLSKRPKQINDCVVRALALAVEIPYDVAYDMAASHGRQSGRGMVHAHIRALFDSVPRIAGRHVFQAVKGQPRMNARRFAEAYPSGRWIVQFAGHYVAVVDGVFHDTVAAGCRPTRCVYSAWEVVP
ncbi:MAG: hypothetical protein ACR652_18615 [Methylocystis sp.]|uniref:hypothetical protein n=1 Tax=Methylocystis sp. TaxID=1911079 RepID=UPI003DA2FC82